MNRTSFSGPRLRGTELFGIILIVIGAAYLANNAGLIDLEWRALWPLLIVLVGAIIVFAALTNRPGTRSVGAIVPREGATDLELDLGIGGGVFHLGGGAAELVEVRSDHDDVANRVERSAGRARVRLHQDVNWFPFFWHGAADWDVRVAQDVPTSLVVNGGAGDFTIDLSQLLVRDARINLGAAQIRVALPRPSGEVRVALRSGASSITIQVPPGVEARVTTAGLMSVDGRTETPGFSSTANRVLVDVQAGASSVRIV